MGAVDAGGEEREEESKESFADVVKSVVD